MKIFLTILLFMIFSSVYFAQPLDKQWYITDSYLRLENNDYDPRSSGFDGTSFSILEEAHPAPEITPANYAVGKEPRNDFFVILSNGSFQYLSHTDQSLLKGYSYSNSTAKVQYLYIINAYEDDDPKASVISGSTVPPLNLINGMAEEQLPYSDGRLVSANKAVSKNADVTFVINKKVFENGCQYNLCFEDVKGNDYNTGNELSLIDYISESNVFFNNSSILYGSHNGLIGSCIENITYSPPTSDEPPVYISLHFGEVNPFINNNSIISLIPQDRDCENYKLKLPILDSNDPNYVEVKCVSTNECGKRFVRYYMQCLNDQPTPTGVVTMSVILPNTVTGNTAFVKHKSDETNPGNEQVVNQLLTFTFGSLGLNDIASVEFCVEIGPSCDDVSTCDLRPEFPRTTFGSTQYAIKSFIDPALRREIKDTLNIGDAPNLYRTTYNVNGCNCKNCIVEQTWTEKVKKLLGELFSRT